MKIRGAKEILTAEEARRLLDYNPETGELTWRIRVSPAVLPGAKAGCLHNSGYAILKVKRKMYQAHRVAWLIAFGRWPLEVIDHINGVRNDNRLTNLRECAHFENMQNVPKSQGKSSKYLGVTFHKRHGKWSARVSLQGVRENIGYFETEGEAFAAYCDAKRQAHRFNPIPVRGVSLRMSSGPSGESA